MNSKIYIVMAYRWGEDDSHCYLIGWEDNLKRAKKLADDEWEHRGCMKYSGVVFEVPKGKIQGNQRKEIYRKGM
jgi:hypothetical protein